MASGVTARRALSLAGIIGPAGFIGAWMLGALLAGPSYSSIDDAISRLLAFSVVAETNGFFQRLGLSATDLWIVASVSTVRGMLQSSP